MFDRRDGWQAHVVSDIGVSPFGARLREWRRVRRLSQLELAARCATTTRHLSFLENGRSRPSAAMVLRLCEVLDVPLRDRNDLLGAAGLAGVYPARRFDAEDLAPYRQGLEQLLCAHDPFPGLVLDRHWRVLLANDGALRLFGDGVVDQSLVEWMLSDGPEVLNAAEMATVALDLLRRQHREHPTDIEIARLVAMAEQSIDPMVPAPTHPVVCPTFLIDGRRVAVVGLAARFEAPADVTVAELRVELFFPKDDVSARFFTDQRTEPLR